MVWWDEALPYFVISDDTKTQCFVLEKYKRGCTEMQVLSEVALRFNLNDSEAVHLRTEVAWRDTSIKKVFLLHLAAWVLKWCSYFLCLADDQPKYCDLPISSYSTESGWSPTICCWSWPWWWRRRGGGRLTLWSNSPKRWYFCWLWSWQWQGWRWEPTLWSLFAKDPILDWTFIRFGDGAWPTTTLFIGTGKRDLFRGAAIKKIWRENRPPTWILSDPNQIETISLKKFLGKSLTNFVGPGVNVESLSVSLVSVSDGNSAITASLPKTVNSH